MGDEHRHLKGTVAQRGVDLPDKVCRRVITTKGDAGIKGKVG